MTELDIVQFMRLVKVTPGCWEWTANRNEQGYGRFKLGKYKSVRAHRFSFEAFKGSAAGKMVCHSCDNPWCVKPAHLFLGTNQGNMDDMKRKGRGSKGRGEMNPAALLTTADVIAIRQLASGGMSVPEIATKFGREKSGIYKIVAGQSWKHVTVTNHSPYAGESKEAIHVS